MPRRSAHVQAVRVHRQGVGATHRGVHRRHRRPRIQHQGRHQGYRGDADRPAVARRGQRGVDQRQSPVFLRRIETPASGHADGAR